MPPPRSSQRTQGKARTRPRTTAQAADTSSPKQQPPWPPTPAPPTAVPCAAEDSCASLLQKIGGDKQFLKRERLAAQLFRLLLAQRLKQSLAVAVGQDLELPPRLPHVQRSA